MKQVVRSLIHVSIPDDATSLVSCQESQLPSPSAHDLFNRFTPIHILLSFYHVALLMHLE
jgi:hypothetical protein